MGCRQSLEQSSYVAIFTVVATGAFTSSSQAEHNQRMYFLLLSFYFIIVCFFLCLFVLGFFYSDYLEVKQELFDMPPPWNESRH